jgi:uncharacterized protein
MESEARAYFLVKDPHWTLVWWHLPATALRILAPSEPLYLRVHDVTDISFDGRNSHSYFDLDVGRATDHWYLYLAVANRVYCAEVGRKTENGFLSLVRSNAAFLPADGPSARTDETWVRAK